MQLCILNSRGGTPPEGDVRQEPYGGHGQEQRHVSHTLRVHRLVKVHLSTICSIITCLIVLYDALPRGCMVVRPERQGARMAASGKGQLCLKVRIWADGLRTRRACSARFMVLGLSFQSLSVRLSVVSFLPLRATKRPKSATNGFSTALTLFLIRKLWQENQVNKPIY